jgi:hypothetical protein
MWDRFVIDLGTRAGMSAAAQGVLATLWRLSVLELGLSRMPAARGGSISEPGTFRGNDSRSRHPARAARNTGNAGWCSYYRSRCIFQLPSE